MLRKAMEAMGGKAVVSSFGLHWGSFWDPGFHPTSTSSLIAHGSGPKGRRESGAAAAPGPGTVAVVRPCSSSSITDPPMAVPHTALACLLLPGESYFSDTCDQKQGSAGSSGAAGKALGRPKDIGKRAVRFSDAGGEGAAAVAAAPTAAPARGGRDGGGSTTPSRRPAPAPLATRRSPNGVGRSGEGTEVAGAAALQKQEFRVLLPR